MAELRIDAQAVRAALDKLLKEFKPTIEQEEVGRLLEVGDGIARVSGLASTMANELLAFPGETIGIALNLEVDQIGAVILGDASHLKEGMPVRRTGDVLSIPVGDAYLGRVVDPLGRPIDDRGPLDETKLEGRRPLEVQAPSVVERQEVNEPLYTGFKAVDVLNAIGRGQRELIIGDRQTGKTALAVDTIIAQKPFFGTPNQVKCIYVAVGQKGSTVREVVQSLEENGAMEYTVVVNADAEDPGALKYIAPYSGCAIGQHWMYKGEHALIIYDDLSKQADAYRQISLLLKRPAGREAYPGDIFYLHSRLLERGAKLSDELGGGSLTALPIIETKEGDLGYIPLNVWSITDGQIFLDRDLFNRQQRPAVDIGESVSRVQSGAQIKSMADLSGPLGFQLAQYRDLRAFALFASDLDKATLAQLERGERLTEILRQPQFHPTPAEHQAVSVFAGVEGFLDDIPLSDVRRFEAELIDHLDLRGKEILEHVAGGGEISGEIEAKLRLAIGEFKTSFRTSEPKPPRTTETSPAIEDTHDSVTEEAYE